jgi:acetolactate synthase small subunit
MTVAIRHPALTEDDVERINKALDVLIHAYSVEKISKSACVAKLMYLIHVVDSGDSAGVSSFCHDSLLGQ